MLTLVEPAMIRDLLNRPNLGCAMLIAACQETGISTTLIKGQTRYLKDIFVHDSEEIWNLIQDLSPAALKEIGISGYRKSIREKGNRQFQEELKGLYQHVIVDKNPRRYFDAQAIEKFNQLFKIFSAVYRYYLNELKYDKLKIIDRYVWEIIRTNPRYIGFSLHGSFELLSLIVRKRVKQLTGTPIVLGGAITPFIDLKELDKIFKRQCCDYLVVGAGERALPALLEALENKREPRGIANVFYRTGGKIKGNDLELIDNLDSLPYPDYSQFDLDLYLTPKRILPVQTARGCSWGKCAFCSFHKINLGKRRTFSTDKIIAGLKHLHNTYHCRFFSFDQEELSPGAAGRISRAILNCGLKEINLLSTARLEQGYNNSRLLKLMRRAGFIQLHWGLESASPKILSLMNKGTSVKTMSQILRKSFRSGISNVCFVFFGFPGETGQDATATIEFLQQNAKYISYVSSGLFMLSKYSPVERNPARWGLTIRSPGRYSVKSGMSAAQARSFFAKFIKQTRLFNDLKTTAGALTYLASEPCGATAHFLTAGHQMLSGSDSLERLKRGSLKSIFPIIFGEIKKQNGRAVFFPIDIKEPGAINQLCLQKEKRLDGLQEQAFILSDGTVSMEAIMAIIQKGCKKLDQRARVRKQCIDFFQDIFTNDWGLGFAKSWNSSEQKTV